MEIQVRKMTKNSFKFFGNLFIEIQTNVLKSPQVPCLLIAFQINTHTHVKEWDICRITEDLLSPFRDTVHSTLLRSNIYISTWKINKLRSVMDEGPCCVRDLTKSKLLMRT